jgi:hypothetical protein
MLKLRRAGLVALQMFVSHNALLYNILSLFNLIDFVRQFHETRHPSIATTWGIIHRMVNPYGKHPDPFRGFNIIRGMITNIHRVMGINREIAKTMFKHLAIGFLDAIFLQQFSF